MDRQNAIMIVDDTEINIAILVDALKEEYRLIVAINGPKAKEILKEETPDLIKYKDTRNEWIRSFIQD